jgi:hypothetical protein
MIEARRLHPKRVIQQELPGGARQQISAAHNFRDSHRRVIDDYRKLIRWDRIVPPHNEIAKISARHKFLRAVLIPKRNRFAIGNPKPPVDPN